MLIVLSKKHSAVKDEKIESRPVLMRSRKRLPQLDHIPFKWTNFRPHGLEVKQPKVLVKR